MSQWSSGKSLALIGPTKRLCHGSVEIGDKGQHFSLEISDGGKGGAFEQLANQNAEPNLNLVHPGSVLRRLVKDNTMGWVREKGGAALHRGQNAGFPFDPQVDVQIGLLSHVADQGFGLMRVEVIKDKMPLDDVWGGLHGALDMSEKILLIPRGASRKIRYLTGGHRKVDDERQRTVPKVFKFSAFDLARSQRQPRMFAFQGLHPGHFVGTHDHFSLCSQFRCLLIQRIDVLDLFVEPFIRFRGQPIADPVRLETPFFSKREAWRAEMVSTMPRFTSSSAISRPVH